MSDARRRKRQEIRLLQRQSTWFQKALFALGKAEEAREKLADARGSEDDEAFAVLVGDAEIPLEDIEEGLQAHVEALLETVRESRRNLR